MSPQVKRTLYLTLVRPKLSYCFPLWRPFLIKYILLLERGLSNLKLLPLMYTYELTDILFAIKSSKNLQIVLNIYSLTNLELDLSTPNYVIRPPAMPSLLILIFVGYPGCEMHYQSFSISVIKHKLNSFYGIIL